MARLGVVVSCYDDPQRLNLALAGWALQEREPFDLIVVNDGGLPALQDVVAHWQKRWPATSSLHYFYYGPRTRIYRLASARNRGVERLPDRCARVLFVDGDCAPAGDVAQVHASYGDEHVVVAGRRRHVRMDAVPELTSEDVPGNLERHLAGEDKRYELGGVYSKLRRNLRKGRLQTPVPYRAVWGCHMSYPRKLLMDLGGLWETFRAYGGEDQEIAWRCEQSGCSLVGRFDTWVWHFDHMARSDSTNATYRAIIKASQKTPTLLRNGGPLKSVPLDEELPNDA